MKAMKNYIWMAALALMAATLTACSSDDLATNETPVEKGKVVTLTATLEPKDGATTRALTDNGTTVGATWAIGEELEVMYEDTHSGTPIAKGKITAVDGSGKATLSVDLIDPKTGGIYFHYPYAIAHGGKDNKLDQIGTLADIATNFDEMTDDGTLTLDVTGGDATLPDVTLNRDVCIWKMNFEVGGSDITNTITALNIKVGAVKEYDISPNALSAIYVAMNSCSDQTITITAATPSGIYSCSKAGVSLVNGKFYRSTITLTAAAASGNYREYLDRTNFNIVEIPSGATTVTSGTTSWTGDLVVSGSVTITGDVNLTGNTNLILKDGASLTVNGCIFGGADYDHGFVYALNIYGQELSTGKLTIDYSGDHSLGVLTASELNIHGGIITVGGTGVWQGLEPNLFNVYHGTINATAGMTAVQPMGNTHIYGGTITAHSTTTAYGGAPAFLLPEGGKTLTISGGIITAISDEATGLESVHSINISGGTINAQGPNGGINVYGASGTSLTISGGNITATSTSGPGINVVAYTDNDGLLTISGGTITAIGGYGSGAGISAENIAISGATTEIDATGGAMMEGILIDGGTGTISGGNITARGGENSVGLEGNITVNGGKVTAIGGDAPVVTDAVGWPAIDGSLTVNGGVVTATGGAGDGMGTDGLGISGGSTIALSGVTMYEGDAANPATPAASQSACTKRYVIIK